MSVKLTLNKAQLEGWYLLLTDGMERNPPASIPDSLVDELMDKLSERIRSKLRKLTANSRTELKMTLTSIEAKAFYCWYQEVETSMRPDYPYEVIVCDGIFRGIDKECA